MKQWGNMKASRHTVCLPHRQSSCGSIKACSSPPDSAPWSLSCLRLLLLLSHLSQRGQYAQDRHLVDLALHGSCCLAPITVFSCSWHFCHLSSRVTCLCLCLCTCPPLMSQGQHANIFLQAATGTTFEHHPTFSYLGSLHQFLFIPKVICFCFYIYLCVIMWHMHICVYILVYHVCLCVFICFVYICGMYMNVYIHVLCVVCACVDICGYISIYGYMLYVCEYVCECVCVCVSLCVHVNGYECK